MHGRTTSTTSPITQGSGWTGFPPVEGEAPREELRQEALAAWDAYQATGRHVTAEEADSWLARLEADAGAEPPTPHVNEP
jgi:hypothetical protein